jgi:hypothetical protein
MKVARKSALKSEHLSIGRAMGRGFLLRGLAALILHLVAVETHAAGSSECA